MSIPESSSVARSDMPPPPLPTPKPGTSRTSASTAASPRPRTSSGDTSEYHQSKPSIASRKAARMRSATGDGSPKMDTVNRPRLGSWAFQYTPTGNSDRRPQASGARSVGAQAPAGNLEKDRSGRASEMAGRDKNDYKERTAVAQMSPSQNPSAPVMSGGHTKGLAVDIPSYPSSIVPSSSGTAENTMPSSIGLSQPPSATKPHAVTPTNLPDPNPTSAASDARAYVVASDTDPLLRMVAAQERRVLELKEDLKNEEEKLAKLKLQWANQEARKKRSEMRRSEQMRPLASPTFKAPDAERRSQDGAGSEGSADTARPPRTKFQGGRHLRTLTLTSPPAAGTLPDPPPQPDVAAVDPPRPSKELRRTSPVHLANPRQSVPASLMGDLRENLWTFIEDLKQATVGDEAAAAPEKPRPGPNRASPRLPPRTCTPDKRASLPPLRANPSAAPTVFRPPAQPARAPTPAAAGAADDADDWDNWDSPPPSAARVSPPPSAVGSSASEAAWSSPRTSTSSNLVTQNGAEPAKKPEDAGKWTPAAAVMASLSPRELGRRASSFMSEWERSLASPDGTRPRPDERPPVERAEGAGLADVP